MNELNECSHAFVERRYSDGNIDWLWVKRGLIKSTDVDCTGISDDDLAARIQVARDQGWKIL
jgi:hypothetical protein